MPYLITPCNGQTHLGDELGLVLFNQSFRYSLRLTRGRSSALLFPRSDSALAESVNRLYKADVINYLKQTWEGVNDVALATLDWAHWYNYERLHFTNKYVSPERGNSKALLRPRARRRAMLVVDAENIYYYLLIPSGYAA